MPLLRPESTSCRRGCTGDGIVDLEYSRRYAESIPGCCFEVISEAGHFPHIEKLDEVLDRSVHSRALTGSWHGRPLSIWVQTWVQSAQILGKKVYYDATPDKKNQYVRTSASVSGPGGRRFESSRPDHSSCEFANPAVHERSWVHTSFIPYQRSKAGYAN
jgi:hypothetical protein